MEGVELLRGRWGSKGKPVGKLPPPSRVVVGEKGSLLARRVVFDSTRPAGAGQTARTRKGFEGGKAEES